MNGDKKYTLTQYENVTTVINCSGLNCRNGSKFPSSSCFKLKKSVLHMPNLHSAPQTTNVRKI